MKHISVAIACLVCVFIFGCDVGIVVDGSIDISKVESILKVSTVNGGINVEIRNIDNGDIDISSNNGEVFV